MSISSFSVDIGIDSGNAKNVEKVLKALEKIKEIDSKLDLGKLSDSLKGFDLKSQMKKAGMENLQEKLDQTNESLKDMLERAGTIDEALKTGTFMTEQLDKLGATMANAVKEQGDANNLETKNMGKAIDKLARAQARIAKEIEDIGSPKDVNQERYDNIQESIKDMKENCKGKDNADAIEKVDKNVTSLWETVKNMKDTVGAIDGSISNASTNIRVKIASVKEEILKAISEMEVAEPEEPEETDEEREEREAEEDRQAERNHKRAMAAKAQREAQWAEEQARMLATPPSPPPTQKQPRKLMTKASLKFSVSGYGMVVEKGKMNMPLSPEAGRQYLSEFEKRPQDYNESARMMFKLLKEQLEKTNDNIINEIRKENADKKVNGDSVLDKGDVD